MGYRGQNQALKKRRQTVVYFKAGGKSAGFKSSVILKVVILAAAVDLPVLFQAGSFRQPNRLYLHPTSVSRSRALRGCYPYGLHRRGFCFRRYVLVVEPSPTFRSRGLAADWPIPPLFAPSHLPFPVPLWCGRL